MYSMDEQICEFNGQTVLVDLRTGLPKTEHQCGYDECPLQIDNEALDKEVRNYLTSPLDLNNPDWGSAFEWDEEFGDNDE